MSLPLVDFRGKITPETDAVLESEHRSTGRDKSEIVREWLHGLALTKIDASIELHKILKREGLLPTDKGGRGNE